MQTLPILQSGERTNAAGKPVSNKILLSVPNAEYRAIRSCLDHVTLPSHLTLHEPSEKTGVPLLSRTISHLLRPPLIDELGFQAAAKWYVEAFSERSGIKATVQLSNDSQRLPRSVELPLFRILQASLSNVHRHAHSSSVDVRFAIHVGEAKLEVKDYGKGINPELLRQFNRSGGGAGIGLAGMRERLRELGGRLEVESDANGTLIRAVIPVSASIEAKESGSAA